MARRFPVIIALLLCLAFLSVSAEQTDKCSRFSSCVECTNTTKFSDRSNCRWCSGHCLSIEAAKVMCTIKPALRWDDECPVAHPSMALDYLSDWMRESMDYIGHLPLLQLSLPGSHDTLTYDLSNRVSDGGIDSEPELAKLLHDYEKILPDDIEDFMRQQAQTHDLTATEQLDNGIRFFDFRAMFEYSDNEKADWYSLHFMESNQLALAYFSEIKAWMEVHTSEVVVLWVSKHGSTCDVGNEAYPNVTVAQKQAFWGNIVSLFGELLVDYSTMPINSTSLRDMVTANKRVVIYASDYVELTGSSNLALDGCSIDNRLSPGVGEGVSAMDWQKDAYANAQSIIDENSKKQGFYLVSLASVGGGNVIISFALRFFNKTVAGEEQKCADSYHVPGMTWCPPTLLDQGQMANYYSQQALELSVSTAGWRLPNAIYINGLDWYGTIRTGTRILWGADRNTEDLSHATTAYAYVDTFVLNNVLIGCTNAQTSSLKGSCDAMIQRIQERRAKFPFAQWEDATHGRKMNFP